MPGESVVMPTVPYDGLKYSNVVITVNNNIFPLQFHTPEEQEYAASSVGTLTTLSTVYPVSTATSFPMDSLYVGCFLDAQNGATATAVDCNLDIVGTTTKGAKITQHEKFVYTPATPAGVSTARQNLRQVVLKGFSALTQLQLVPVNSDEPLATPPNLIGTNSDGYAYTFKNSK